jgi:hypothetical protein
MKLQPLFLFLCACFLTSCYGSSANNNKANPLLIETNEDAYSLEDEDFYVFLDKFSIEDIFQLSRIKFPLSAILPDYEDEGRAPKKEFIGKHEWETLDLSYDSTFTTRPFDRYYQTVHFFNDTALVELRGINNGIYGDYYFKIIDGKWYLVMLNEEAF